MSDQPKRRSKARWMVLGVLTVILLSLAAILLEVWISAGRVIEREKMTVADRVEAFRNERVRIPNVFDPPEDGNAWTPYREALDTLDSISSSELDVFPSIANDEAPRIDDEAIALMAVRLGPAFDHLKLALRRREVEPHEGYDNLISATVPIGGCLRLNRILKDLADHEHRMGDDPAALELMIIACWTGMLQSAKGFVVGELIRSTIVEEFCRDSLKLVLEDCSGPASAYRWFGQSMDRLDDAVPAMGTIVRRDHLMMKQAVLKMVEENKLRFLNLDMCDKREGLARHLPPRIRAAQWFRWTDRVEAGLDRIDAAPPWERPEIAAGVMKAAGDEPIALGGDSLPQFYRRRLEAGRDWSLMRLSIALVVHRLEVGSYPQRLEDLLPGCLSAIPVDPWNGKPFAYVNRGDHAILYAFGDDGDDDGGRPIPDDSWNGDGDIVWTIKRRGAPAK